MSLVDGIFLSALVALTGGYDSILYWLFLGLIVRGAVSVPRATSQILLNLTLTACYVMAGVINIYVVRTLVEEARFNAANQATPRHAHASPAKPANPSHPGRANGLRRAAGNPGELAAADVRLRSRPRSSGQPG